MISYRTDQRLDVEAVLGAGGPVSKSFSGFEERGEQLEMARRVQESLEEGRHLAVEAGTGVGKSFAYLVSAIDQVRRKKGKVVVSTFTITLQEQIAFKDLPFLQKIFPDEFGVALAKGRSNYLCLRRLQFAESRQEGLFERTGSLGAVRNWAGRTQDGSLSDLPARVPAAVWDMVSSEHGNCRGRRCPHFGRCFYWKARRKLETADIIVANHALLLSDILLKSQDAPGVLPEYRYVIIDEAQNLEHVAEDQLGINLTEYRINHLLNSLHNPKSGKGLLASGQEKEVLDEIDRCRDAAAIFFRRVRSWYRKSYEKTGGRCTARFVDDSITGPLKKLRVGLSEVVKSREDEDEKFELLRLVDRCRGLEQETGAFLCQEDAESVYWVESDLPGGGRGGRGGGASARCSLRSAPINAGPYLKQMLFDEYESVILTSATLSSDGGGTADEKAGFEFFASRVGLEDFDALKLGSPFDYGRQVTIYIEANLPEPNNDKFEQAAVEAVKKYLLMTAGRAFVLFTSYEMLRRMAGLLEGWMAENGMELLQQGGGMDRGALLRHFRTDVSSVLFGTDTFWQGVDVPGETLSNVIIVRLPFAVPNHPLIAGRIERIRLAGENPFLTFQLPSAIMKFKQGFGRLIRSKADRGIIVVLDSRIARKSYGKRFLAAVPKCRVEVVTGAEDDPA